MQTEVEPTAPLNEAAGDSAPKDIANGDVLPLNRWLVLERPSEPFVSRTLLLLVAFSITAGVFYSLSTLGHFVSPRIGQNGYQFGGRMLAETGNVGFKPTNGYQFIDFLWVVANDWYFPKYPAGVPALNALILKIGGWQHGVWWSYHLSSFCSAMSTLAVFLFIREIASSFIAILGQLLLTSNQLFLILGANANSHPPALFFATWGMLLLLWWWRTGWISLGLLGGFFLGYTFTTRYSEGLLALPIGVAMLCSVRWKNPRSYLRVLPPMIGWHIPVLALLIFNKLTMNHWTGYDTTNESSGFRIDEIANKWEYLLSQLHEVGMFFILPLGLFGLCVMFSRKWKVALLLLAWFLPQTVLYAAYYWGNNESGVAYLRFFLTLIPPIVIAGAYLLYLPLRNETGWWGKVAAPVAVGACVAVGCATHLSRVIGPLERDHGFNFNLTHALQRTLQATGQPADIPHDRKPIMFSAGQYYPGQLQYAGDYEVYATSAFDSGQQRMMRLSSRRGANGPRVFQSDRGAEMRNFYEGKSSETIANDEIELIRNAITSGRRVFASMRASEMNGFRNDFNRHKELHVKSLAKWKDPAEMSQRGKDAIQNIGMGAAFVVSGARENWEVCEIVMPPEVPPTTAPATLPVR